MLFVRKVSFRTLFFSLASFFSIINIILNNLYITYLFIIYEENVVEMDGRDSWELDYVRKDVMGRNNAEDSHEGTEKKGETPLFHLSLSIIPLSRQSFFLLFFSFFFLPAMRLSAEETFHPVLEFSARARTVMTDST